LRKARGPAGGGAGSAVPIRRREQTLGRHLTSFAKRLAGPLANAYRESMCRHITKEQHIEGWRAAIELLPKLRPGVLGDLAGALMARLQRGLYAAAGRRA
jgi:hypothetical protein